MARIIIEIEFPDMSADDLKKYMLRILQQDDPDAEIEEVNAYTVLGLHWNGELESLPFEFCVNDIED